MPASITIRSSEHGFHFELTANNGEPVLNSEYYDSFVRCKLAAEQLQQYCSFAHHFIMVNHADGKFAFYISDLQENRIATSAWFWSANSRDYAATIVRKECPDAKISEIQR